jgi:hypothetical protein
VGAAIGGVLVYSFKTSYFNHFSEKLPMSFFDIVGFDEILAGFSSKASYLTWVD